MATLLTVTILLIPDLELKHVAEILDWAFLFFPFSSPLFIYLCHELLVLRVRKWIIKAGRLVNPAFLSP